MKSNNESQMYIIDKDFNYRIFKLQVKAMKNQYLFACLSTLGGAYHLTNKPIVALTLAKRQERLGWEVGAPAIIFKSLVYQGLNYSLLGKHQKSKKVFQQCEEFARKRESDSSKELLSFLEASKSWLETRKAALSLPDIQQLTIEDSNVNKNEIS